MSQNKFKISLRENGEHSFARGIEAFLEYESTKDEILIKDAIMFLHHGIELLMKEILVQYDEYLIFEDLNDLATKKKKADKQGIDIFALQSQPKTIGYSEALTRVDAFITSLDDDLRNNLITLNNMRNQLEHYAIEADRKRVIQLLGAIHDPLLKLIETQIGEINQLRSYKAIKNWESLKYSLEEMKLIDGEVSAVIRNFNGQKIPGSLLNIEAEISLPTFDQVEVEYWIPGTQLRADIWAEGGDKKSRFRWMIEVKYRRDQDYHVLSPLKPLLHESLDVKVQSERDYYLLTTLRGLKDESSEVQAIPWLIVFTELSPLIKEEAKRQKVMITGDKEWQKLKRLVKAY